MSTLFPEERFQSFWVSLEKEFKNKHRRDLGKIG
jgi:hypothetical protein